MESREQQMFEMFEGLRDYSEQPPSSVYQGMRKKLWWSEFLSFNLSSLNIYYVGLLLGAGLAAVVFAMPTENVGIDEMSERAVDKMEIRKMTSQESNSEAIESTAANTAGVTAIRPSESEMEATHEGLVNATPESGNRIAEVSSENTEDIEHNESAESTEAMTDAVPETLIRNEDAGLERIEPEGIQSIETLPYNNAIFTFENNLLEQLANPNTDKITVTIKENREVEREK